MRLLAAAVATLLLAGGADGVSAQKRAGSVTAGVTIVPALTTREATTPVTGAGAPAAAGQTVTQAVTAVKCESVCGMTPSTTSRVEATDKLASAVRYVIPDAPAVVRGETPPR